ncbi:NADP-dependent aldehyde dehydrogenase [Ruegeria halocynthiae]|uniref:NADP-dependent aldehyde dehydrogenase n=1 Tax=Ruegeria halocynthiae TaxID=985054 RepID=A0A1H3BF53_9RHOB|nr:aldehyde dehydrogenase (NADP(+)) [Ruegeria halocynthiae]SDX40526.1 NADP-dependent aldehyde dehydrogenase [Ruegeria halocynthiae]
MITGKHYIAGEWLESEGRFSSTPVTGGAQEFCVGTPALVEQAAAAAEEAFEAYGATSREARATFLERIAEEIDARGDQITTTGCAETGLPQARLQGERGRTVGQLRLFASHIRAGDYLDRRHDAALPDRVPLPRPELRMVQRPIGPVAVFGASNFPLAFSVAGGDTASALAAGCPVIVKGHSAHPGTSEIVAQAIAAAVQACGMPNGVFSLIQGGRRDVGEALVQHPLINAVGFTGSLGGGRALFDLCATRPMPIPFFGELGSINPVFVLPNAARSRAAEIGTAWAGSLIMGAGQFCTNPGVVFIEDSAADAFINAASEALAATDEQAMLTDGIAEAYRLGAAQLQQIDSLREVVGAPCDSRSALPYLFETTLDTWQSEPHLAEEVFGPLGIVVRVPSTSDFAGIARGFAGQLTATLQMDAADTGLAASLRPILERKAGRILANGFPTGVEVSDTMVHGGPYPASTNFGATSVGTLSIRRWLRPVCYQAMPESILPEDAIGAF